MNSPNPQPINLSRVRRSLIREGRTPEQAIVAANAYKEALNLALAGRLNEAKEACTPSVIEAWQLHRLDTFDFQHDVVNPTGTHPYIANPRNGGAVQVARWPNRIKKPKKLTSPRDFNWKPLEESLMKEDGLSLENARVAIQEYAAFITGSRRDEGPSSPTDPADAAWHRHILGDPVRYATETMQMLGRPLFHEPNLDWIRDPLQETRIDFRIVF